MIRDRKHLQVAPDRVWASPVGQRVLADEERHLERYARRMHGDRLLWVGSAPEALGCLDGCMVRHAVWLPWRAGGKLQVDVLAQEQGEQAPVAVPGAVSALQADLAELPFANASFDAIVLHHALECCEDPRQALREINRVLAPGGKLLVCTFNPWSLMGLRLTYARLFADDLSGFRPVRPYRLSDWLALLGYKAGERTEFTQFGWPRRAAPSRIRRLADRFNVTSIARWLEPLISKANKLPVERVPLGGVQFQLLVKQSRTFSGRISRRRAARRLAPVAYPRVASWERAEDRT